MESFSEAAFARLTWCVRVCSIQCMCLSYKAPACLPNCFSVVFFVFLCVVVSHVLINLSLPCVM